MLGFHGPRLRVCGVARPQDRLAALAQNRSGQQVLAMGSVPRGGADSGLALARCLSRSAADAGARDQLVVQGSGAIRVITSACR